MLKTFLPNSELLKKYIEVFYVFAGDKPVEFSYIAFPHVNTSISFFRGVTVSRDNYEVVIEPNLIVPSPCCVEILGKYTQPVFVHYKGDFEEVAIVFKPFGVNQFLPCDLIKYVSKYSQPFSAKNWLQFAPGLFREQNETKRIEALEEFLLAIFQEIENETISKSLELLANADMDYSIETIASICSMNVKTFQRQFLKHITCTPSEYKRIARFRFALQTKILSREIKTLTDISYESNYYDQSYFIREFKKLTGLKPKKFFDAITVMDKKKIIWEIK